MNPLQRFFYEMGGGKDRNWSQGRISGDDDGDTAIAIAADKQNKVVRIQFTKPIEWLGFPAEQARQLAAKLIEKAKELES